MGIAVQVVIIFAVVWQALKWMRAELARHNRWTAHQLDPPRLDATPRWLWPLR